MSKKTNHARKLSPEAQAALKKHREAMNARQNPGSDPVAEQTSARRSVNQKTNQVFKKGGQ
ncbi:MAG TPA: hypothetical protein VMZ25_07050 [Terriglobales bacterium]|nr:hypothetical protein [Terriglobales bacterium]